MRKVFSIGILRETKQGERRTPLAPRDVKWLIKRGIKVEVESSPWRIFSDKAYRNSGAKIVDKLKDAVVVLGIKEPLPEALYANKIYMLFSHTMKGQAYNMPLLKSFLKNKITLIDYERITDSEGKRLVYFGRFAGICGIVDSLSYLGQKLKYQGIKDQPFSLLRPAYHYGSLQEVKRAMREISRWIRKHGFGKNLSPFIIGVTGHGRVSQGVQEILDILNPIDIYPRDMAEFIKDGKGRNKRIYKVVFLREEIIRSKIGKGFYFEEYLSNPHLFESNLDLYLPLLNMLIHTSYWDSRFPRMVTKEMVQRLARLKPFRLKFIGDIACDVNGSIELTYKTTSSTNPTFTFNPKTRKFSNGYRSDGISILAVDNLPTELPKDASLEFSMLIRDYAYQIAAHGAKNIVNHIALPVELRRAVITQCGRLPKDYRYLNKFVKSKVIDKTRHNITILSIGDRADFDSYRKFHKERNVFTRQGFDYANCSYERFLEGALPEIETEKVIIFLFFPFAYWNKFIEYKDYRGIYGNRTFYKKFVHFWADIKEIVKKQLANKDVLFINQPSLCGLYRDKAVMKHKLAQAKIPTPKTHTSRGIVYIEKLIAKGNNLFVKARYGSMGKGITFLNFYSWHTNFIFRHNKIHSRRSDHGWKFRDITGESAFLRKLLRKDIIIEDAVNPLVVKRRMIDLRMYVFFKKVIYIYPRKNKPDKITTNISQGARGDPSLLQKLPRNIINKAKRTAVKVSKALNLNFVGMDIMIDRDLKHIYVIDVNVFPGFPKRRTFNLTQSMITDLAILSKNGEFGFERQA